MLRSPFFDFDKHLPGLSNFFPEEVKTELSTHLGSHFKVVNAQILELNHNNIKLEEFDNNSTVQFHSDPYASDVFRYFVFLDDVTERDGPTEVLDRENSKDLMKENKYSELRKQKDAPGIRKLIGEKGQSALFDVSNNLHRAGNPEEGHSRILIMFVLLPSREPMGEKWFENTSNYSMKESQFSGLRRALRI